ncbi:MAG: hypothetical protein J2P37_22945, partial [Ktedonobacteraceae bacterium]|nr:hypothetical protein [Ktedonobacteraceae bacterium]
PDPILSLLAALGKLPPDIRAIAQIGLVPARPDWSKRHFFSLKMLPPSAGDPVLAESIRARCRVRYTRRVVEIDEMLQAAMIQNVRLISMENREGKRPGETAEPEQLPVVETSTLVPPLAAPPVSEGATPHAVERITPAREPARSKQTMTTLLRTESERAGKMQVMAERDDELPQGSMRSKRSWGPWQPQQNMGGGEMSPHVSPTSLRQ